MYIIKIGLSVLYEAQMVTLVGLMGLVALVAKAAFHLFASDTNSFVFHFSFHFVSGILVFPNELYWFE